MKRMKNLILFLSAILLFSIKIAMANSGELFENNYRKSIDNYGYTLSNSDSFGLQWVNLRIFAPDGGNKARFSFWNPNYSEVTIKIFDITGSEIRKNLSRETEDIMFWDGTDDNGKLVRAGIYIYQLEADGKIINGTIIVVR